MQIASTPDFHLRSTVGELVLYEAHTHLHVPAATVMEFFMRHSHIPGIIMIEGGECLGLLSRKEFFEHISKPFSHELYYKRPISVLYDNIRHQPLLLLPHTMPVVVAVQKALERSEEYFTDPLIVETSNHQFRILDVYQLLQAHSRINTIALQKLKETNAFKTELLGIAAHDLKNPLNSILNIAKVMQEELEPGSFSHEMTGQIYETSQHMLSLVLELLNSSVIETGRMELKKKPFDLHEVVSAIIYQNRAQASRKEQVLEYHVNSDQYYVVNGDGVKLRESMENLISNAIKYSPAGKTISVELRKQDEKVYFSVRDEGPGLSEEDKEKLFGKFQRLSAQPTAGESSTGLGLYITKQIIDLHEGAIRVESTLGQGSTFIIELPAEGMFD